MKSMRSFLFAHAAPYGLGVILAVALKYHYSVADSEDLQWILSPTSWFVQRLTGMPFEWEEHTGFVSRLHGIIIAPSCAGVNFLIIAFSTLYFTTARLMPNGRWRVLWLGITIGISYILTLGVNGLRIVAAISLYQADIYGGWLTPERAHRIEGTLIYFSSLLIAHLFVNRIARHFLSRAKSPLVPLYERGKPAQVLPFAKGRQRGFLGKWFEQPVIAPFLWYCLITLGIPLLNHGPLREGLRFMEHGVLVLCVCAGVLLSFALLFLLWQRAAISTRGRRRGDSHRTGVVECAPSQKPESMRRMP
jgi:exosortase K